MTDSLRVIPVIKFSKEGGDKHYISTLYHLKQIYRLAKENGYKVFITEKLENASSNLKKRIEAIQKAKENSTFQSDLWTDNPECKILPYQAQAINVSLRARKFLIGDDMGLGKTPEAAGVICKAFEEDYKKALIVCPNRLKYQWKSELLKFTKIDEKDISVVDIYRDLPCPEGKIDKLTLNNRTCKDCSNCDSCRRERNSTERRVVRQLNGKIILFNYELFDRMKESLSNAGFDIFILDEATRMKNMQAQTTKAILKFAESLPEDAIILPMSGYFIENKIEEIYPPLTLVDKGILGEYHNFKNNYLVFDFWGKTIGIRNEKRLKGLISPWIIRRSIDEVWKDRPPLVEIPKTCEMTKLQRKIYEDARDAKLKELENTEMEDKINMAEIGALLNYLIQICDTVETMDPSIKESGKMDVLKEIVSEEIARRHKVLIFSFFANKVIPIIKREMSEFGDCLVITGATKPEEAERIKERFIRTDTKFLICSDSMAYGANLQIARYVINFDLPWNPAKIDQRIRRVYRKGQTKTVTAINLVTTNSVEDKILEKIGQKRKIFDMFLGISTVKKKSLSMNDLLGILRAK